MYNYVPMNTGRESLLLLFGAQVQLLYATNIESNVDVWCIQEKEQTAYKHKYECSNIRVHCSFIKLYTALDDLRTNIFRHENVLITTRVT